MILVTGKIRNLYCVLDKHRPVAGEVIFHPRKAMQIEGFDLFLAAGLVPKTKFGQASFQVSCRGSQIRRVKSSTKIELIGSERREGSIQDDFGIEVTIDIEADNA